MVRKEIDVFGDLYYYNEKNQVHRTDGPAVERANGYKQYFLMNKQLSYEEWLAIKDFPLLW